MSATIQTGAALIAAERARQIEGEGFTAEQDDHLSEEQLAYAACAYAYPDVEAIMADCCWADSGFPSAMFKPGECCIQDRIRALTKAGALCAAEIDRLWRLLREKAI